MAKQPRSQAERSEATRQALLDAATKVVGQHGYAGASIGKITAAAQVAQGTFYYHFRSQQELFDCLLPALGERLLHEIRTAVAGCTDGLKREELGFRTFFNFMARTPEFYRVLTEAEVFAPRAYWSHMNNISGRYLRALTRSWQRGEIRNFEPSELETLTFLLSGAMFYLTVRYNVLEAKSSRVPEAVVRTYVKFVAQGMGIENWQERLAHGAKSGRDDGTPAAVNGGGAGRGVLQDGAWAEVSGRAASAGLTIELGQASDIFPCGHSPDLLRVLLDHGQKLLLEAQPTRRYQLQSFSQHVIATPQSEEGLVGRLFNSGGCEDIAVVTLTIERDGSRTPTVAVASGIFAQSADSAEVLSGEAHSAQAR